jgi:RNA polymerase sigma-70 factor (ECF subfamily)
MTDDVDPATLKRIEQAIRKLPRRQREVFAAVRFDDLSYVDIAEQTGLTVSEVEQLFAAALFNISRQVDRPRHWWRFW